MEKIDMLSPLALAFIGDAVHTKFVREYVLLNSENSKINNYQNNINIILISLCITMGNFESVRRRHNNNN